jgi:2-polyprenyl-3-methyl-5-hydroxy-6-metoxy-1,4-benzoquinol methylase
LPVLSLEEFKKEYETDVSQVTIRDRRFQFFVPKTIDRFLNPDDPLKQFPLWAKIWDASLILADELASLPVHPGTTFLEIGCGLGLVGIIAASFGHEVTMTEYDPHALAFARANASLNGLAELKVVPLDWNQPPPNETFDLIIGSEVIYHERDFDPIRELFARLLRPGGEIILCAEIRKTNMAFLSFLQNSYAIKARKKTLRSEIKNISIMLFHLSPKQE